MGKSSISRSELLVLRVLSTKGALSIEEVSKEVGLSAKEVKHVLDLLLIKGLIKEINVGKDCKLNCSQCPLNLLCPRVKGCMRSLTYYILTEKGSKIIKNLLK